MVGFSQKTKIGFAALALSVFVIIVAVVLSWRPLLETQIKNALEERGFENVQLTLSNEEQDSLSFKDVQLGAPVPLSAENITVTYAPLDLLAGKTGTWQVKNLQIRNDAFPLPALNGKGTIFAQSDHVAIQGQFESADHAYKLRFQTDYSFRDPNKRELTILSAVMPWNGGTVATQNVKILLEDRQVLDVKLNLERVSADALLKQLTGQKASATGTISGTLPVTIDKDGTIAVHEGTLQAQEPGIITLSPDVIPGDNPQVDFVRNVMKDLHYTLFSVRLDSDKNNRLSVLMTLHGNNPAVQNGRAVELNVHLTGDMLNFVQQNLIWLSDPQKLLERGQNENK
ncbi:MAG: YdbH domain-containing protein [Bdellovibrionales bacterium]|jgi:hypothetical protein